MGGEGNKVTKTLSVNQSLSRDGEPKSSRTCVRLLTGRTPWAYLWAKVADNPCKFFLLQS